MTRDPFCKNCGGTKSAHYPEERSWGEDFRCVPGRDSWFRERLDPIAAAPPSLDALKSTEKSGSGVDQERSTARTTDAPRETFPPTLEQHLDMSRREGFFEFAYKALERRTASLWKELKQSRDALERERENVREVEGQSAEWRALAVQYGTETTAEKRKREHELRGSIVIAAELARHGDDAITHACLSLAKKLIAASKTPPAVDRELAVDPSRSTPKTNLDGLDAR